MHKSLALHSSLLLFLSLTFRNRRPAAAEGGADSDHVRMNSMPFVGQPTTTSKLRPIRKRSVRRQPTTTTTSSSSSSSSTIISTQIPITPLF
ncbi:uncharacterized protein UHOD_11021 [Ustilago sp. UG-2017b]|nr:uncharacterized protein UHOD_11021 [Ustilago sp. UG-2017b]